MRPLVPNEQVAPNAQRCQEQFHSEIIKEVDALRKSHEWLVVGMKMNPVVKNARKFMDEQGLKYHYVGYGSYFSMWKPRLALKMWVGWPTYPMIFHKGVLVGGFVDLKRYLKT